jgi:hypothetical protein
VNQLVHVHQADALKDLFTDARGSLLNAPTQVGGEWLALDEEPLGDLLVCLCLPINGRTVLDSAHKVIMRSLELECNRSLSRDLHI